MLQAYCTSILQRQVQSLHLQRTISCTLLKITAWVLASYCCKTAGKLVFHGRRLWKQHTQIVNTYLLFLIQIWKLRVLITKVPVEHSCKLRMHVDALSSIQLPELKLLEIVRNEDEYINRLISWYKHLLLSYFLESTPMYVSVQMGIDLFILLTSCNWSNSAFFKMAFKDVTPNIC